MWLHVSTVKVIIRTKKNVLFKVQKGITQWDPISFTVEYKLLHKKFLFTIKTIKIKQ